MGELKNELRSRQTDRASRRSRSGTTNSLMFPSWLWFCLAGRGELQPDRKAAGTGGDHSVRQHPLHRATTLPTCVATARIMIATKPAAARVSIGAIPVNVGTTRPTCAYRKLPRRKCRRDRLCNKRSSRRPVHARTDGVFGNHSSSTRCTYVLHPLHVIFEHGDTALHRRPLAARSSAPTFARSLLPRPSCRQHFVRSGLEPPPK
jgi:hypothetical protein